MTPVSHTAIYISRRFRSSSNIGRIDYRVPLEEKSPSSLTPIVSLQDNLHMNEKSVISGRKLCAFSLRLNFFHYRGAADSS